MASGPAKMADELPDNIRAIIDRVLEADIRKQISERGRDLSSMLAEGTTAAADRAYEMWRESAPARRDAMKTVDRTWRREIRPTLRDLWKRRSVAIGAAGAAVPVGRELVESAAARLRREQRREQRHWGAFFLGLLIGAAAGAVVALLTTPKPGRQMRAELATKASEVQSRAEEVGQQIANRARETDWAPLFEREGEKTNGAGATEVPVVADVAMADVPMADVPDAPIAAEMPDASVDEASEPQT
jgi:gas vesicle protein